MDDWDRPVGSIPSTSLTLLQRLQARQPEAWQEAMRLYGPLVYGWCRSRGLQGADARDVTQEVFRNVAEQIARFQTDRPDGTFRGWLWQITSWRLADFHRRQGREPVGTGGTDAHHQLALAPDPNDPGSGSAASAGPAGLEMLEAVRAEFSDRTWQCFWMSAVEGRSGAEIAAELGCSTAAVYMARSRVLARLRQFRSGGRGEG